MSAAGADGGAGAVVRQGHLRKLKTMKKKYFVLRSESADCSARLDYYESEKKFRAGAAPRRVLPLKSCYNITRRLDLKQKHVIALFTREEQFCVVAENEQELHAWLSAILRQHSSDEHSDELLHPIQHVWQVNVQKKGLGASKNIQGLYNLCLTDKTLTLVKIKSHNNVISDLGIPERVEYSLKNIRRCGDSECFFYMEVGRQTVTGAGELWMHSDDANIAQSMHSTIYHAMRNCAKETENERDHISMPKGDSTNPLPARRQTISDSHGRAGLSNDAAGPFRNRCDSMPSRACVSLEADRPPTRHTELIDGLDVSRDETDTVAEWHRTPRIPEEPDYCEMGPRELFSKLARESAQHSRTSSMGASETSPEGIADGYLPMAPDSYLPMAPDSYGAMVADGYLPMAPLDHGLVSASSGSVCSGTPSTDPRFSEYQLEPATSHIVDADERPPRAYSVGSRPAPPRPDVTRLRAYSVGARNRPPPAHLPVRAARASSSAPLLPRASADDLMELDFSHHPPPPSHSAKVIVSRTPPSAGFARRPAPDEDSAGYVEMRPGAGALGLSPPRQPATPDGYVEMRLGSRTPLRPPVLASSPQSRSLLSDTLFPLTLEAPEPPAPEPEPEPEPELELELELELEPELEMHQPLTTLREISEEGARKSPELSSSPSYVSLSRQSSRVDERDAKRDGPTIVKAGARCSGGAGGPGLHYAALDLEPRAQASQPAPRLYTQIDFLRSEKLHAADN